MKNYLGLDLGTNSVGWALTDENYNIQTINGKAAWGVRTFSEASDAKERRAFRANRRRLARRKFRIKLLQGLFSEEVSKRDANFFARLNESIYVKEHKSDPSFVYPIFGNKEDEVAYHKKYPTIYHLRKELLNPNCSALNDIRLVYLAIHHIIKYRGNFLFENRGYSFNPKFGESDIVNLNNSLCDCAPLELENQEIINPKNFENINEILINKNCLGINEIKKELKKYIQIECADTLLEKEIIKMITTLLAGGSFDFKKLVNSEESIKLNFKNFSDDKILEVYEKIGEFSVIVKSIRVIYDSIFMQKLLGNNEYFCTSMIARYVNHKKDLNELKTLIKKADKILNLKYKKSYYYKIFDIDGDKNNYPHFVHYKRNGDRCTQDDFYKFLSVQIDEILKKIGNNKLDFSDIIKKMSGDFYLSPLSLSSTSAIPHQLHLKELIKILENIKSKYPTIDASKIISIFKFKIPFYVGPLKDDSNISYATFKHNIIKKDKTAKIKPWNFDEIIDIDATRSNFMNQRTLKCTYLLSCDVLPKSSLLYEEYAVRDKINAIQINETPIDIKTISLIFNKCKTKQFITKKDIAEILVANGYFKKTNEIHISGIDDKMTCGLLSYIYFSQPSFGLNLEKDDDRRFIEDVILHATVYKDNPQDALNPLVKKYLKRDKSVLSKMLNVKTNGYGSYSREFLNGGVVYVDELGERHSIINLLRTTTKNLNQILFADEYGFDKAIKAYNNEHFSNSENGSFNELFERIPPLYRRPVNQALKIIDELISLNKNGQIDTIFIETTRKKEKIKSRTKSRKEKIKEFLNSVIGCKDEHENAARHMIDELESIEDVNSLNGEALYLYFIQLGYDLYTAEKIDINDVSNSTKYDVDHIIPRSKLLDNSIDNKVLVSRHINQNVKKNLYPLPSSIRTNPKVLRLWKYLYDKNKISSKKYANLLRNVPLTEDELNEFVNRQLVSLSYSNRCLKDILEIKYPNIKIVFSKSSLVSDFRNEFEIIKNRDVNDAHHAVDAYLNVVVGNVVNKTYNNNRRMIIKNILEDDTKYTLDYMKVFVKPFNSYWSDSIKERVYNTCFESNMLFTHRSFHKNGAFYKQTIFKHSKSTLMPIHTSNKLNDCSKYGGYTSSSISYFALVKFNNKKGEQITLVPIPTLVDVQAKSKKDVLYNHINSVTGEKQFIILNSLLFESSIRINKTEFIITGITGNSAYLKLLTPAFLSNESIKILDNVKKISKSNGLSKEKDVNECFRIMSVDSIKPRRISLSKLDLLNVFKEICSLKDKDEFSGATTLKTVLSNCLSAIDRFKQLSIFDETHIISELLKLIQNGKGVNLTPLNLDDLDKTFSVHTGCFFIGCNFTGKPIKTINKSITGLFIK